MQQDDRLIDAKDLGIEQADAAALVAGTASWKYAVAIFARLVAAAAAADPNAYDGFPPDTRTRAPLQPGGELVQVARSIEGMHGPLTPEEHLERRYLWDEGTALGRVFACYTRAADIHGMDALDFAALLQSAIREAAGLPRPTPLGGSG
jgi:hypothetical protein